MAYLERVFETEDEEVTIPNSLNLNGVFAGVLNSMPAGFTLTPAAGATNVCDVVIQAVDENNEAMAGVFSLLVWVSDAATGVGLTGTSASGTVQAKSASGADFSALTAKKALMVQTLANGTYTLEITDTAKTAFYACVSGPGHGTSVTQILATADYGTA